MPFSQLIGHAAVLDLLRQAVARDRVPQSLLFAGPHGVGKRSAAVALAQAVNCPVRRRDGSDDACGSCPTCTRIAAGHHSDVVVLDKGDDAVIKLKPLRSRILDVVGYRPFEAAHRVFIVDTADDLRPEAQDALLKTLEEPPRSAILVLLSAYPDSLLPTILSRCRRVRFGPLSVAEVARVLEERLDVPASKARVLAAAASGSPARALDEDSGALEADRASAVALLQAATGTGVGGRLKAAAALAKHGSKRRDRQALGTRLAFIESLLRDLGALAAGDSTALANADLASTLEDLRGAYPIERAVAGFQSVGRAQHALDRNASPKIVADWIAVRL